MINSCGPNVHNNEVLRIVMVGRTGNGKSATGNTILGRPCFQSKFGATSMTVDCSEARGEVNGKAVAVIDTPGLFDTRFGQDKTTKDISQCISYASPGPHVFLVVIRLGRYTAEEKQTVQMIQQIFGDAADRYSMVLFTHGDLIAEENTTIEEFLQESPDLQELVDRCNGQYHVFNNKLKDRAQVTDLIRKIRNILQRNGGNHYTNQMFQEAERVIEEEKRRIEREEERQRWREREEVKRKVQERFKRERRRMIKIYQAQMERERMEREEQRMWEEEERAEERKRERWIREAEREREREERERMLEEERERLQAERERETLEEQERLRRSQRDTENNDCHIL